MRNIQFTSRQADYNVLATVALVGFSSIAGLLAGFFIPTPFARFDRDPYVLAVASAGVALFVWSIFRLIRPARIDRNWQITEVMLVPLFWLLLMITVYLGFNLVVQRSIEEMQELFVSYLN